MVHHLMEAAASDQYSQKAVLLTGGAGFIGFRAAIRIVEKHAGIEVVVFDSLEYCGSIRNLDAILTAPNLTWSKSLHLTQSDPSRELTQLGASKTSHMSLYPQEFPARVPEGMASQPSAGAYVGSFENLL
jgi:hypothetical protein